MARRALAAAVLLISGTASALPTYDECERGVRLEPKSAAAWRCFEAVGQATRTQQEAIRRLEAHLAREPDRPATQLALGRLLAGANPPRAEKLLRAALAGSVALRDAHGEIEARIALGVFDAFAGRMPEAEAELARMKEIAASLGAPIPRAQVGVMEAFLARRKGDLGRAWSALDSVEGDLFPAGPAALRALWLDHRSYIAWTTGRLEEAVVAYQALGDVLGELGDRYREANQRSDLVVLLNDMDAPASEKRRAALDAREAARASGNKGAEILALAFLAEVSEPAEAAALAREAVAIGRASSNEENLSTALRAAGLDLLSEDRETALRYIEEARSIAVRRGSLSDVARTEVVRSRMLWTAGPRDEALRASEAALAAAEATRDLLPDSLTRARRFSQWSRPYYELAGHLLAGDLLPTGTAPSEADVALAFRTVERMRSRVLLDELDASRASSVLFTAGSLGKKREEALQEIARVQRQLLAPGLTEAGRADLLRALARAELEESTWRAEMVRADPSFAAVRSPVYPTLGEVRSALGPSEALLVFILGDYGALHGRWGASAWVLTITHDDVRVRRLEGTRRNETSVALLRGLIDAREGAERVGVTRLYDDLLRPSLDGLPSRVQRVTIVPDRELHQLPFAALRAAASSPALAERFEIDVVPSVTVWLRARRAPVEAGRRSVVAFADPVVPGRPAALHPAAASMPAPAPERAGFLPSAGELVPLGGARIEARRAVTRLGQGGRLLVGEAASEAAVKSTPFSEYAVVHFATHALLDDAHPERTAILLAPGNEKEDGLLQLREIVGLKLAGRVVVLSECRSAAGLLLGGEGPMGLARGFFQAGASAVIGSLWALRDDEAAAFFDRFYAHLAAGRSVAAAVARAQRDRIRAGAPVAAWAGIVALGNGSVVPFPGGAGERWPMLLGIAIGLGLALALAFRRATRRRRRDQLPGVK